VADPAKLVQRLTEQLDALRDAFGEEFAAERGRAERPRKEGAAANPGPPLDVYVTPNEVVIHAVLPGLPDPRHVIISLTSPTEILLEAYIPPRLPEGMYLQRERFTGYCSRLVTLPASVRPVAAAKYLDGILEIRLQRANPGSGDGGVAVLHVK
jgi:HSP20 family molecular chaperone IbpA